MKQHSSKNKIILLVILWLCLSVAMFMYFFNILDVSNRALVIANQQKKKEKAQLAAQFESYKQAQGELLQLSKESFQPENFFSRDITLVNEIKTLEGLSEKYNLTMELSGISGTVNTAPKAQTVSVLLVIPYSINVKGSLAQVVDFIETLENLSFITNVNNVSVNAADKGSVAASMTADFYLRP